MKSEKLNKQNNGTAQEALKFADIALRAEKSKILHLLSKILDIFQKLTLRPALFKDYGSPIPLHCPQPPISTWLYWGEKLNKNISFHRKSKAMFIKNNKT